MLLWLCGRIFPWYFILNSCFIFAKSGSSILKTAETSEYIREKPFIAAKKFGEKA
jgi:hypothetical protein